MTDLQKKSREDLEKMLAEQKGKMQQFRFDVAAGKNASVKELRTGRKNIAQILTAMRMISK